MAEATAHMMDNLNAMFVEGRLWGAPPGGRSRGLGEAVVTVNQILNDRRHAKVTF